MPPRPFFYGSSTNRLNSKGQVAIPKRFRNVLDQEQATRGFVLIMGEQSCIYMYTHDQFEQVKERVRAIAREENDQEFLRSFLEQAHAVDLDTQNRFVLPATLRHTAGITTPEVLFIGMDDRIEIWSPHQRSALRRDAAELGEKRALHARRIFGI